MQKYLLLQWTSKILVGEPDLKLLMQSLCLACDNEDSSTIGTVMRLCLGHFPIGIAGAQLDAAHMRSNLQKLLDELGMQKDNAKAWAQLIQGKYLINRNLSDQAIGCIEGSLKSSTTTSLFRLHANRALCDAYLGTSLHNREILWRCSTTSDYVLESCRAMKKAAEQLGNIDLICEAYFKMVRCWMIVNKQAEALEMFSELESIAKTHPHDPYFKCVTAGAKAMTMLEPDNAHYKEVMENLTSYYAHLSSDPGNLDKMLKYMGDRSWIAEISQYRVDYLLKRIINAEELEMKPYVDQLIELEDMNPKQPHMPRWGLHLAAATVSRAGSGCTDTMEKLLLEPFLRGDLDLGAALLHYYFTNPGQRTRQQTIYQRAKKFVLLSFQQSMRNRNVLGWNLINVLEERKNLFSIVQRRLLMHPMADVSRSNQLALIWSERGRTEDLKQSIGNQLINNQEFDKDDDDAAWSQICNISSFAGEDTAFLVFSRIGENELCHYFLHRGRVRCQAFGDMPITITLHFLEMQETLNFYYKEAKAINARNAFQETQEMEQMVCKILFRHFISPWKATLECLKIRNLVIIPNKETSRFSFASFLDPDTKVFLIQQYIISYAPSLFVFHQCQQREQELNQQSKTTALIVANPKTRRRLPPLRAADKEGDFTSKILRSVGYSIDILRHEEATPTNFLRLLPSKEWIHIASHAIVDPKKCPTGAIALASEQSIVHTDYPSEAIPLSLESEEGGSTSNRGRYAQSYTLERSLDEFFRNAPIDEGNLSGYDIENRVRTSKARGVVLSACQTAIGETCAEGVLGLCRSFHMLGVPMLVVSLTKVDDEATRFFMKLLYKNLHKGKHIAVAVQEVMKLMIEKKSFLIGHWAPFIISGSPYIQLKRPIELLSNRDISNLPSSPLLPEYMFDSKKEYEQCKALVQKLEQMVDANGKVPPSLSQDKFDSPEEHRRYQMLLQLAEASEISLTQKWIHDQLERCNYILGESNRDFIV